MTSSRASAAIGERRHETCSDLRVRQPRRRARVSCVPSKLHVAARFRLADAQDLPFSDASFDVVASALVMNFVPDRARAIAQMRRVARPGGLIAACVWDFAAELSPSGPLRRAMRRIGIDPSPVPGTDASGQAVLADLFENG